MNTSKCEKIIAAKWADPDRLILNKIKALHWTAHNIPLTATESTIPGVPLIAEANRTKLIKQNLRLFAGRDGAALGGLRVIDLGCLEGGLAFEMAREDMDVIGIEGRASNYSRCELIRDYFELPNLKFLHLDVKDITRAIGNFDIVLCCGLLYHLDDPVRFLHVVKEITHENSILFLDTHFAPLTPSSLERCSFKAGLSDVGVVEHQGRKYRGRWYREWSEDGAAASADPWAAVSNYRSFWLLRDDLIRALYGAGFKRIYDLYGGYDIDQEFDLRTSSSRLYCIAVKETFFG